jgi:hypothetical protein
MVKSGDASIELVKDNLAIEALPKDLPKEIVVDVSKIIDPNTVIFVKDLDLPAGVESEDDLELPVVTVVDLKKSAAAEEAKEAAAEEASLIPDPETDNEAESKDVEKET